jgi:uncharacterized cofD-like protein
MVKSLDMNFQTEQLVEAVLNGGSPHPPLPEHLHSLIQQVHEFDCSDMRVVVFGGGTGLSTVVGGNSQLANWLNNPNVGLKQIFPHLDVVVCTTDDGRSTGEFLKHLPMIGIGDVRKLCLSMIDPKNLAAEYSIDGPRREALFRLIHCIFNHRFSEGSSSYRHVADPLLAAPESLRDACPKPLSDLLRSLGTFLTPKGDGPTVPPGGHCLGNMLLTAAIFNEARSCFHRPPAMTVVLKGIDRIARAIGARPGRIHPATAMPGQLIFRYANGVEVHGQSKSSTARRGFPVERVYAEFYNFPAATADVIRIVRSADLIILAPGSLYTSSIPVLQVPGLAEAIRANRTALKVLGANFWVEEGETDITYKDKRRGFRVSELLEAYDRNVPGGCSGLFHFVLSANLQHISGNILRNYALEGKRPIYLDRQGVEAMRVQPVESTIFSMEHLNVSGVIHHDPIKFALAVRTLLFVRQHGQKNKKKKKNAFLQRKKIFRQSYHKGKQLLCDYWSAINTALAVKNIRPTYLRDIILDLVWENRDIQISHLDFFTGARIVPAAGWKRSIEWDSVLGYYDTQDRQVKINSQLLNHPAQLRGNILIALGESLLGRYIQERTWIKLAGMHNWGARCYQIRLLPPRARECYLTPTQLHDYLVLARMVPHPRDSGTYRITLNNNDGFLPPGLLFGLMYAWYLDNSCAPIMENEMSILHLQEATLIPHQAHEYRRKKALVDFFRKEVFGYAAATAARTGAV